MIRIIADEPCRTVIFREKKFAVASGNKLLIIRHRFEDYLDWCCDNNIPVGELADEERDSD